MSWDTPNYAVPGLMPTTSPKADASVFSKNSTIILSPYTLGDTWEGIAEVGPVLFNGEQPVYTLTAARMLFQWAVGAAPSLIMSSAPADDQGTITISDDETWELVVESATPELMSVLFPGLWPWTIEATDSNGEIKTLYKGVLQVLEPRAE